MTYAGVLLLGGLSVLSSWYFCGGQTAAPQPSDETFPLGFVLAHHDQMERRSRDSLLWHPLTHSDPIHLGDAVRTGASASGVIYLGTSHAQLHLQPESLIVFDREKESLAVSLLAGDISIQRADHKATKRADGSDPFIRALSEYQPLSPLKLASVKVKGNVALLDQRRPADFYVASSAGKNEAVFGLQKGEINLGTASGKIKISSGVVGEIKNGELAAAGFIRPTAPLPGRVLNVGPEGMRQVRFSWLPGQALPRVRLKTGAAREILITVAEAARPEDDFLTARLPLGSFFWQLVAVDPVTLQEVAKSPVFQNEVLALPAPFFLQPRHNEEIAAQDTSYRVGFTWSASAFYHQLVLELAVDPHFNRKILEQDVTLESGFFFRPHAPVTLYGRLCGKVDAGDEPVCSRTLTFTLTQRSEVASSGVKARQGA
jgi:hypothetical protein